MAVGRGEGNCQLEERRIKNLRLDGGAVVREGGSPVKILSPFVVAQRHRKEEKPACGLQIFFANERKGGGMLSAAQRQSLGHH